MHTLVLATKIEAKLHRCKSTKAGPATPSQLTIRPTHTHRSKARAQTRLASWTRKLGAGPPGAGPPGSRLGQGSEGGGTPKMAASMCDVFSFCVGVAGPARVAVEVRFVSSAKVRPRRTVPRSPSQPGLGDSPAGPHACSLEAPLPLGHRCPAPARAARGLRVGPRKQAFRAITRWAGAHAVFVRAPSSRGTRPFCQLGWGAPGRRILLLDPGSCWAGRAGQRELRY